MKILITFFLINIALLGQVWAKERDVWKTAAMACVPTSQTISGAKYETTAGVVKFKNKGAGLISFICPFSGVYSSGRFYLSAWAKASDNAAKSLSVQLRKRNVKTGATATVMHVSHPSPLGATEFREFVSEIEKVDFSNPFEVYWVQISIKRQSQDKEAASILSAQLSKVY